MLTEPFPYLNLEKIIEKFQSIDLAHPGVKSYLISYGAFVRFFEKNPERLLNADDLIIGIHFAYGWMPTIFEFKHVKLDVAVGIINDVRSGKLLSASDLGLLKELLNNSIVGTSKLLHFINPHQYAIWDSRVYRFVTGRKKVNHERVNRVDLYVLYLEMIRDLVKEERFLREVHRPLCSRMAEEISPLRALELVLFLSV